MRHQGCAAAFAAARNAQIAGHGLKKHGDRRSVVAQVALGDAVHLLQVDGLHGRVVAGEFADGLGGDAGDGLGPLGAVLHAVHFADDVLAPFLEAVGLDPLRHVVMVVEVLGVEDVGDRQAERRVGAGPDGNPLGAEALGADVVHGVDQDELAAALLGELHVVGHMAEPGHHRIEAPQHHQLGVQQIGRLEARKRVARALDEDVRQTNAQVEVFCRRAAGRGVVAPAGDGARHVGCEREVGAFERHVVAVIQPGMVGVLLRHLLHLFGDGVECFVPGNPLEMAFACSLFADALHGVEQAILGIQLLAPGVSHGTGAGLDHAGLHRFLVVVFARDAGIHGIVRLDGNDLPILHAALDEAGGIPTAIVMASGVKVLHPLMALTQLLHN